MILDRYLVKQFVPIFLVAASMFMLLILLIDLFANIWNYLNYEVTVREILTVSLYYLPKSFSYSLPIALLFAAAYTLGDLYSRNELTSVFTSGIPFWRFAMPLLVIGLSASVFTFFFDDLVVIPSLKLKNDLSRVLLRQQRTENNSDIVIKARGGLLIYSVDYYDSTAKTINGVNIIEQDEKGRLVSLIRSSGAVWKDDHWVFSNPVIYEWEGGLLRYKAMAPTDTYREEPDTFRRNMVNVEDLSARDAGLLVQDLRAAGLPFIEALTEYHHRFSFPLVSFVVMILSISMGGRFKRNILLMCLLSSLGSAVVFYVMEMVTMMMAKLGYIPPTAGAWFPVATFVVVGFFLLRGAKT
jgi:lipopolysaccharide export system permease protein